MTAVAMFSLIALRRRICVPQEMGTIRDDQQDAARRALDDSQHRAAPFTLNILKGVRADGRIYDGAGARLDVNAAL